jgi:hypothetical protein
MAIEFGIAWKTGFSKLLLLTAAFFTASVSSEAQSTEQAFPTAVTENEIAGTIRARDVGDARLTTYYYTFGGGQGDLFLNVVTRNFNGDIDLFLADGLKPLTKIVVYADVQSVETGRVVYLRKPEKLLLRIEGRTPNDDAAEFRFKFAGSFVAVSPDDVLRPPKLPEVRIGDETGIRVNSVGTIIPQPKRTEEVARVDEKPTEETKVTLETPAVTIDDDRDVEKPAVVVTDTLKTTPTVVPTRRPARRPARRTRRTATKTTPPVAPADEQAVSEAPVSETPAKAPAKRAATKPKAPDPMENIQLLIMFKDGRKIERPMTEVLRFTVDRGMLTVISKNGTVSRYSILDVESVSIR